MKMARIIILIASLLILTASLILIATNGWTWKENRGSYLVLISIIFTALSVTVSYLNERKNNATR